MSEECEHLISEKLEDGRKEGYCGFLKLTQPLSECPFPEKTCIVKIAAAKFKEWQKKDGS